MSTLLDLNETFPHLNSAPIVEAVIELKAAVSVDWTETSITDIVKPKLPDYPTRHSMTGFQQQVTLAPGIVPEGQTIDTGWSGLRFETADGLQIAQFKRDGFSFSRLRPYEDWERLLAEAMRLWEIFMIVGRPVELRRIGVRFINRIDLPSGEVDLSDYLQQWPEGPRELTIHCSQFFYADSFALPGLAYRVNRVRTTQPADGPRPGNSFLVVDIDVSRTETRPPARALIEQSLSEMRWLKNKVFFGSVTPTLVEKLK